MPHRNHKNPLNDARSGDFERELNRRVRTLPMQEPDLSLRSRILKNLPSRSGDRPADRKRRALVMAALVTLATGIGILAGPRLFSVGTGNVAAAEVRAAVQKANTWHLHGWKLVNGKQTKWEIWGRRSPFFYREEVGDSVIFDDGKQRLRLLDADRQAGRKQPIALRMFPQQISENQDHYSASNQVPFASTAILSPDSFLDESHKEGGTWSKVSEDSDVTTLRRNAMQTLGVNPEDYFSYLMVDKRTRLPRSLEWQVDRKVNPNAPKDAIQVPAKRFTSGHLDADFDVPLVEEMTRIPDGAIVIDMTAPTDKSVPVTNAVTKNGLTLAATSVKRDADGNVQVVFGAWLGNERLDAEKTGLMLQTMVNPMRSYRNGVAVGEEHLRDSVGMAYAEIQRPPRTYYSDRPDAYYVPVMPINRAKPAPQTMTLDLRVTLSYTEIDPETHYGKSSPIMTEDMTLTVALPKVTADLGYDRITADDCLAPGAPRWTLKLATCEARASYYHLKVLTRPVRIRQYPDGRRVVEREPINPPDAVERANRFFQETIIEAKRSKNKMAQSMAEQNVRSFAESLERQRREETKKTIP